MADVRAAEIMADVCAAEIVTDVGAAGREIVADVGAAEIVTDVGAVGREIVADIGAGRVVVTTEDEAPVISIAVSECETPNGRLHMDVKLSNCFGSVNRLEYFPRNMPLTRF